MELSKEKRQEIANTILMQMGGSGRLSAMVGASQFSYGEHGELTFMFKMCRRANIVTIKLNSMDLYDATFKKYYPRKLEVKEVKEIENIYAEDLKGVFERFTGLYLTL